MAKNTIADLDTTASNNTDVLAQSTQGTAAVSTIDTMIQNSLALLARFYADLGGTGTVGGTADAITLTTASTYQALENGLTLAFKAGSANTGAATINVDSLGAKAIRRIGDSALSAGDIAANGVYLLRYDTAYNGAAGAWILLNSGSGTAATTSAAGIVELATLAETLAGTDTSRAVVPANLYFPTGHLYGLTLSNNVSDATNDIDIAAGTARDGSDSYNMILASALTKRLDASWAVGSGNGGLDTGSIANTTYHVWLIKRSDTGVVDALFSTSASSPTMPTNYDIKRRIGSIVRTGAAIKAFRQIGDFFQWTVTVVDVDATNPGTGSVTRTLTVPTGITVQAHIAVGAYNATNNFGAYVGPLTETAAAVPTSTTAALVTPGFDVVTSSAVTRWATTVKTVMTNTSGQVFSRQDVSGASDRLSIVTRGYEDTRGRAA